MAQLTSLKDFLYSKFPEEYRTADINEANQQLYRFISSLSEGGLDVVKGEIDQILTLFDFDMIPAQWLPNLASALGFEFPFDLDEQTQRTYIKNAVLSYRIKGTEKALLFMIRELTRFKTTLEIDNTNKHIDVYLEVELDRQNIDRIIDKTSYIIKQYAPPLTTFQVTNTYLFNEDIYTTARDDSYDNAGISFDMDLTDEAYGYALVEYADNLLTLVTEIEDVIQRMNQSDAYDTTNITMGLELETKDKSSFADTLPVDNITIYTDFRTDGWFLTNTGLTVDTNYRTVAEVEAYNVDNNKLSIDLEDIYSIAADDGDDTFPQRALEYDEDVGIVALNIYDDEVKTSATSDPDITINLKLYTDYVNDGWFLTNDGLTVDMRYAISAETEVYKRAIADDTILDKITMV